jgi:hypothetical protein
VGQTRTPTSVAAGGVAFDPIAVGTTTVDSDIPGLVKQPVATLLVTINP